MSVVSPIYNAEPYLRQCLDSLAAQTLPEIEFICIDDGSTDNSLAILNEYADNDRRFRIITKPNAGYGATMNLGLSLARGRYVGFLDSDDFTEPDTYQKLYQRAEDSDFPDIVKANYFRYSDSEGDVVVENYGPELCKDVMRATNDLRKSAIMSIPTIWAGIYRVDFLSTHGLRLSEAPGVSYQDTAFVLKAWIACSSFAILHDAYHHYRIDNPNSSVKAAGNAMRVCEELDDADAFLGDADCLSVLSDALAKRRLDTYEWNFWRLHGKEREEFVMRAHADFKRLGEEGRLNRRLFSQAQWSRVQLLIDRPMEYYAQMTYGERLQRAKQEKAGLQEEIAHSRAQNEEQALCLKELRQIVQAQEVRIDGLTNDLAVAEQELRQSMQEKDNLEQCLKRMSESVKRLELDLDEQEQRAVRYRDIAEKQTAEMAQLRLSKSYRIGRVCTWLPRKIRGVTTKLR